MGGVVEWKRAMAYVVKMLEFARYIERQRRESGYLCSSDPCLLCAMA